MYRQNQDLKITVDCYFTPLKNTRRKEIQRKPTEKEKKSKRKKIGKKYEVYDPVDSSWSALYIYI